MPPLRVLLQALFLVTLVEGVSVILLCLVDVDLLDFLGLLLTSVGHTRRSMHDYSYEPLTRPPMSCAVHYSLSAGSVRLEIHERRESCGASHVQQRHGQSTTAARRPYPNVLLAVVYLLSYLMYQTMILILQVV